MGQWIEALLERSRERKLGEIAAAYAVVGWLLVQVASIALPAYEAPTWLLRWFIAAIVLGFPAALACGWIWNRQGAGAAVVPLGKRDALFLALLGLVGVLTLGELAWHWSSQKAQTNEETTEAAAGSVAVLPFANTGSDVSQKYFGEGIADELIGLLARNNALRVAARTSSFYFEGKEEDIRTIARRLNVRAVLEGSVREDRGRVRIEATLINGADGYQIWSQSYDRDLSDVLQLQSDIATAIAQSLAPEILGRAPKANIPAPRSIDPDAYRMYLEGQYYFAKRTDESEARALELFRQVTTLSPDFADGQAALAYAALIARGRHPDQKEWSPVFKSAITRALRLDPTNPQALTVAIIDAKNHWDWNTVVSDALILKHTNRHSAIGAHGLYFAYSAFRLDDLALNAEREWAHLDPLSITARGNIANQFMVMGRFSEVPDAVDEIEALSSDGRAGDLREKCEAYAQMKKLAEAEQMLKSLSAPGMPAMPRNLCRLGIAAFGGRPDVARTMADDFAEHYQTFWTETRVGQAFATAGEYDRAMDWFERAFDKHDPDFFEYDHSLVLPAKFFEMPRWIALTQRPEYEAWEAVRERAIRELADAK
jgi:adenylate cyclase